VRNKNIRLIHAYRGTQSTITTYGAEPPSDFDYDGRRRSDGLRHVPGLFHGPNRAPGKTCTVDADFDSDNDVDLNDFGVFQGCFNGPNRPPACAEADTRGRSRSAYRDDERDLQIHQATDQGLAWLVPAPHMMLERLADDADVFCGHLVQYARPEAPAGEGL